MSKKITEGQLYRWFEVDRLAYDEIADKINSYFKTKSRFTPPTVDQINDYLYEATENQKYSELTAEQIHAFYEQKDWKVGKTKMKNWKLAVKGWYLRELKSGNAPQKTEKPTFDKQGNFIQ